MANEIDLKKTPDKKDFGPRVGFVYDLTGKGNTVLRGGYGIYYDRIILESGAEELVQNDRALTVSAVRGIVVYLALCAGAAESGCVFRADVEFRTGQSFAGEPIQRPAPDGRRGDSGDGTGCASSDVSAILTWRAAAGGQLAGVGGRTACIRDAADHRAFAARERFVRLRT